MKSDYTIVGAMAGSSMDGLDLALVHFKKTNDRWSYEVLRSGTFPYDADLYEALKSSKNQPKNTLDALNISFGEWIGEVINEFIGGNHVDLLAVHGHTALHNPNKGISFQLGDGKTIAHKTGITTITDFRSLDVKLGGEGAPLVPFGDFTLFEEYDACLNLGGIANISYRDLRMAWDVCPCNQVLNYYAKKVGKEYDDKGNLARQGVLDNDFIESIKANKYFHKQPPKSLPNDFLSTELLESTTAINGLRSYTHFIARQIADDLPIRTDNHPKLLITGGGAFNNFLISEIQGSLPDWEMIIPDELLVSFKEAIVFGFLGLKRFLGEINVLCSVTGGSKDSSSGVIHLPK